MNQGPVISIVMAAFNEEQHIGECIDSVLNQTFRDFEFIVVNDGSTDRTEEIILSYNDQRIRHIRNTENLKLIKSLNIGLKAAKGKYITRMDADDICVPERLAQQFAFMESHPHIGISGSQLMVFGSTTGAMHYPLTHDSIRLYLMKTSCFGNNVVMFRKNIMEQHQLFFPEGYLHAEDYKCWTNWIGHTQAANLDAYLVKYRAHQQSVSVQHRQVQRETRNRVRKEYLENLFGLSGNTNIASDFTGPLNRKRIRAIRHILDLNARSRQFDQEDLRYTIFDIWYSDSLELAEKKSGAFFRYPLIFSITFKGNFRNWFRVLKHHIRMRKQ
jgi:glycosyltransferase involved in cell wall biosynthesis